MNKAQRALKALSVIVGSSDGIEIYSYRSSGMTSKLYKGIDSNIIDKFYACRMIYKKLCIQSDCVLHSKLRDNIIICAALIAYAVIRKLKFGMIIKSDYNYFSVKRDKGLCQ